MLQQICEHLRNYFIKEPNPGTYKIENGSLYAVKYGVVSPIDFLIEGQRFWLVGSVLNDGVYTWHADGIKNDDNKVAAALTDETFTGRCCALAVPKELMTLSDEIAEWVEKYGDVIDSPYFEENVIGVYSYQKGKSNATGSNDFGVVTWQSQFGSRLDIWRRIVL